MVNILTWSDVNKSFRITADTSLGKYITIHLGKGRTMVFNEVDSGLYLYQNGGKPINEMRVSGFSYLMLAQANLADFKNPKLKERVEQRDYISP